MPIIIQVILYVITTLWAGGLLANIVWESLMPEEEAKKEEES
jgi:phage shock protein PspC (stress-responsive transcriptional regulator)